MGVQSYVGKAVRWTVAGGIAMAVLGFAVPGLVAKGLNWIFARAQAGQGVA